MELLPDRVVQAPSRSLVTIVGAGLAIAAVASFAAAFSSSLPRLRAPEEPEVASAPPPPRVAPRPLTPVVADENCGHGRAPFLQPSDVPTSLSVVRGRNLTRSDGIRQAPVPHYSERLCPRGATLTLPSVSVSGQYREYG